MPSRGRSPAGGGAGQRGRCPLGGGVSPCPAPGCRPWRMRAAGAGPRCRRQAQSARVRPGPCCALSTRRSSPRSSSTTTAPAACCPSGWTSRASRAATRSCSRAAGASCTATGVGAPGRAGPGWGVAGPGWVRWGGAIVLPVLPFSFLFPFSFFHLSLPFLFFSLHFLCSSSFFSFSHLHFLLPSSFSFSFSFTFSIFFSPFSFSLPTDSSDWGHGSGLCTQS